MSCSNDPCSWLKQNSFWFEFAAEKLGISSPPPYLSLSQNDDALLKGVNYASGGAGILNDTGLYFVILHKIYFAFELIRELVHAYITDNLSQLSLFSIYYGRGRYRDYPSMIK